jgi:hypothetical protein
MHEMANPAHSSDAECREEDALLPSGADHMATLAECGKGGHGAPLGIEHPANHAIPSRPAVRRRSLAHGDLRLLRPTVTASPPARLLCLLPCILAYSLCAVESKDRAVEQASSSDDKAEVG